MTLLGILQGYKEVNADALPLRLLAVYPGKTLE
jgi:hypothetical protein